MKARWVLGLLMAATSIPGWGQSQDWFALSAGQVARALSDKGMQLGNKQVSLPASVVATEPNPVLEVLSVEPPDDQLFGEHSGTHSWVKLGCGEPGICLPFYAILSWTEERIGGASDTSGPSSAVRKSALKPSAVITMRAGTRATLVMDDDRSHIRINVISLENGIIGHEIRVASPDHKQVYLAEVVNAHLLRRSL
jgi:hypothetical protein